MSELPLPPLFPEDEVAVIVQDVIDCCRELPRPGPQEKRPEECLSKTVFLRLTRIPRYRTGPLQPDMESWLPDAAHRGDIRFSCGRGLETYFLIEAKRLFVTYPKSGRKDSLIPKYIAEGMMRFVRRRYAPFQHQSAVLGYVFDEALATARSRLAEGIDSRKTELRLSRSFRNSQLPVNPPVNETGHRLKDGPFTLYHLLVAIPAKKIDPLSSKDKKPS